MKNYIIPSALAAALLLLSSCTREPGATAEKPLTTITFGASAPDTRTEFGDRNAEKKYPVTWKDGDKVAISHNWSDYTTGDGYTAEISNEGRSARFVGDFTLADGANTFIVVSPFAAAKSRAGSSNRILVEWPAAQSPKLSSPSSPDPLAQVLVARNDYESPDKITSPIDLQFEHLSAYLRMKFKNVNLSTSRGDATVLSVSIGAKNTQLAGRFQYYFGDGHFDVNADGFNAVTASVSSFEESSDIWVGMRPVDFSGETLTFTITTDKGSLTKDVTLPVDDRYNLSSGSVATFTVNMDGISIREPVVYTKVSDPAVLAWGDLIIIAAADGDIGLSTVQNTNNRSGTSVTKVNDGAEILDPSDDVQIIKLEDGVVPGQFSFNVGNGYLYAQNDGTIGKTANILQTIADKTGKENHASWSITNDNGTTRIKANLVEGGSDETTVRPHLRYNTESNIFTAYSGKGSQKPIAVYYLYPRPDDVAKHFVATMDKNGKTIYPTATMLKVNVFSNVDWTAKVTAGGGSLSADSGSGTTISGSGTTISGSGNAVLTLNILENTGVSDIIHTVTVSSTDATGAEASSYELSTTQIANNILYFEYFDGAEAYQTPETYLSSGNATTKVFGESSVTYTSYKGNGNTRAYVGDDVVYDGDYAKFLPKGVTHESNMMVGQKGGWWKISGIPCTGVATAELTYDSSNVPDENRNVITPTDGVTMSKWSYTTAKSSKNNKSIRRIKYTITFDSTKNLDTFELQFNNNHTSNIRVTNVKLKVLTVAE